eukprot:478517-Amphidinium_carterae.1
MQDWTTLEANTVPPGPPGKHQRTTPPDSTQGVVMSWTARVESASSADLSVILSRAYDQAVL